MPADVKQLLWPMELGQLLSSRAAQRLEHEQKERVSPEE